MHRIAMMGGDQCGKCRISTLRTIYMRPLETKRTALVAAVDVGTSKVTCLIARLEPHPVCEASPLRTHAVKILAVGQSTSRGIMAGAIANFDEAEQAMRQALDSAEGRTFDLQSTLASVSGGRIASQSCAASVEVAGVVRDQDITRVLAAARPNSAGSGRAALHYLPNGYSIDSTNGIHDPRKMLARRLGTEMLVVSIDAAGAVNLLLVLESCYMDVAAMVVSPYAAGLSVLSDDEMELGAAVVDMGAGTTTLAVFSGSRLLHASGFALGGHHVTMDLARGLNVRIEDAERVKRHYGLAPAGDTVSMRELAGEGSEKIIMRSPVVRIIK